MNKHEITEVLGHLQSIDASLATLARAAQSRMNLFASLKHVGANVLVALGKAGAWKDLHEFVERLAARRF